MANRILGLQIRDADARRAAALIVEEAALQEAHRCRLELGKFQERGVLLQAAMVHIDEDMRRLQDVHKTETAQRLEVPKSRYLHEYDTKLFLYYGWSFIPYLLRVKSFPLDLWIKYLN